MHCLPNSKKNMTPEITGVQIAFQNLILKFSRKNFGFENLAKYEFQLQVDNRQCMVVFLKRLKLASGVALHLLQRPRSLR